MSVEELTCSAQSEPAPSPGRLGPLCLVSRLVPRGLGRGVASEALLLATLPSPGFSMRRGASNSCLGRLFVALAVFSASV